jgi:phospholipase C
LATGRIVEAITKSSYWPSSAILITEDDAQDGLDHVDGHRTLCFVVSPYARRRDMDSTQYNHTSLLRTIEEMLGLPPMNKFDAAALPLRSAFTTTADLTGFVALPNTTALDTLNPAVADLRGAAHRAALESGSMDFSRPDAAPEGKLNQILWHAARGWRTPYPSVKHRPVE